MELAQWLTERGIRPEGFAVRIGVSTTSVYRYLSGDRLPEPPILRRIAEATVGAVRPDDFILAPAKGEK